MTKGTGHAQGRHGNGRLWKVGRVWWVQYYVHGQQVRESSRSDKKAVAEKLLMRRLVAADDGTLPFHRNISYEEMRDRFLTHQQKQNPGASDPAGLEYFNETFKGMKASAITEDRINELIVARKAKGLSNATINRMIATLRRMFRLSDRWVRNPPDFSRLMLPEPPARKGFLERAQYLQLLAALPVHLRPIYTFGYHTGMRLGELKDLTWKHVDLLAGEIRLGAEDTKNGKARTIPYGIILELAELMQRLYQNRASGSVFTREKGKPLGSFRKAWIRACIKSGLGRMLWACPRCHKVVEVEKQPWPPERAKDKAPVCDCGNVTHWKYTGLIFHDLRRSAVRNLRRADVPESVIMKISGHETHEVFQRYNIVDRRDLVEAMEKLAEFHRGEDAKLEQVPTRPI